MARGSSTVGRTIGLRDGRALGYAEWGALDGAPVMYFHGLPGSRLDLAPEPFAAAARAAGVRAIAVDRPGFGLSEFQPGRRYLDWPADVAQLADVLGLERFAVLGYSCGGPYAAACAQAIPDRLTATAIVSGVGPPDMPRFSDGLGRADRRLIPLARRAPWLARLGVRRALRTAERDPDRFLAEFEGELSPPDRKLLSSPDVREAVRTSFLEAGRAGPRGMVHDWAVWGRRWDLRLEAIAGPVHVQMWHGDRDATVPLHHAEEVARRVAGARLIVWNGEGHLHAPEVWREVLAAITG
jgi:pimeloyl-ACP methyl ester carboxylesterase